MRNIVRNASEPLVISAGMKKRAKSNAAKAARLRQKIAHRSAEMQALAETLSGREEMFRGRVYDAAPKCGKPECHCAKEGKGHPSILVTLSTGQSRR